MLILGIDPGSLHTGYGYVEKQGSKLVPVHWGRFSCPRGEGLADRLAFLSRHLDDLLAERPPDLVVLETPFHGRNSRSLITLAQARGALLARLAERRLTIVEYSPAEIKSTVTGNGRAAKDQVARMVCMLLALGAGDGLSEDTTDALAIAICGAQRHRFESLERAVRRPR